MLASWVLSGGDEEGSGRGSGSGSDGESGGGGAAGAAAGTGAALAWGLDLDDTPFLKQLRFSGSVVHSKASVAGEGKCRRKQGVVERQKCGRSCENWVATKETACG
jgi:hypothetical protein